MAVKLSDRTYYSSVNNDTRVFLDGIELPFDAGELAISAEVRVDASAKTLL